METNERKGKTTISHQDDAHGNTLGKHLTYKCNSVHEVVELHNITIPHRSNCT